MSVPTVSLGDVADLVRGITFKPDDVREVGSPGSVVCLRTKNVQAEVDLDDLLAVSPALVKRDEQWLEPGDILISSANSWNLVGKCCWVPRLPWSASFGGFVTVLRPKTQAVDRRYLFNWVNSSRTQQLLRSFGRKTTNISNLSLDRCREMALPLPPIEEQRRIATMLDAADALRAKRRLALAKLDTLMPAIFDELFGLGAGEEALIGDLGEVQGGLQVSAKRKGHPIQVPYLRVANVHRGRLDLSVVKTLQVTEREFSRVCLEEGDLLVVEGHGNKAEIGRVGMWDGSIDPCVHQNHLIRVRCNRLRLLPRYAEAFLNSRDGRRALLRAANTTSGLNTISTSDVRSVAVSVPALSDQQRFVEAANRVDQHRSVLMRSAAEIDTLLASLQQRAFRGEL